MGLCQAYDYGCNLFFSCGDRDKCRDRSDHLCSSRSLLGFLLFNVYPASVLWEIPVPWHWAALLWQLLYAPDAIIYPDRRTDLSGRKSFRLWFRLLILNIQRKNTEREEEYLRWHLFIITSRKVVTQKHRLLQHLLFVTAILCLIGYLGL